MLAAKFVQVTDDIRYLLLFTIDGYRDTLFKGE